MKLAIDLDSMITYETIRSIHRSEKDEQIAKLPEGFFRGVQQWLSHKKIRGDMSSIMEAESAKKLLEDIINRRQRKIITSALGSARGSAPPANMTMEESQFFDKLLLMLKGQQNEMKERLFGASFVIEQKMEDARKSVEEMKGNKVLEKSETPRPLMEPHPIYGHEGPSSPAETSRPHISPEASQPILTDQKPLKPLNSTKKVRILTDRPRFVDANGTEYGPFKTGETAEVPEDVFRLLSMQRAAELTV